jgi:hypothetical protein
MLAIFIEKKGIITFSFSRLGSLAAEEYVHRNKYG